jgi:hypothetical protein
MTFKDREKRKVNACGPRPNWSGTRKRLARPAANIGQKIILRKKDLERRRELDASKAKN